MQAAAKRPTLVIGNKHYSSWSLRPWLLLRARGVDFDEVVVPLDTPEFHARIAALSPSRRVPALLHDGVTIWDSLAICEYADEQFLDRSGQDTLVDGVVARSTAGPGGHVGSIGDAAFGSTASPADGKPCHYRRIA